MILSELSPRWIHPNLFVFLCPHCRATLLSCKSAVISHKEQHSLFETEFGEDWNDRIIGCRPETVWSISGSFSDLTVSPSIDASHSGHWHGHIIAGQIS